MKISATIFGLIVFFFLLTLKAWADWSDPQNVVVGTWGSDPGQFFFGTGGTFDSFPRNFGVDNQGRVFINDESNARIQLFRNTGSLEKIITAPQDINTSLGWPYSIYVHPNGSLVGSYDGPQKFFFDSSGDLVKKVNVYGQAIPTSEGYLFEVSQTKYFLFSPTGELLKTTTERPLELGRVKERPLGGGRYKVTVEYSDRTWGIVGKGRFPRYIRDSKGNLYASGDMQAARYNKCGRQLELLTMPEAIVEVIPSGVPGIEPIDNVQEEYGAPVLAPNGDVYTWKRTPDTYSILKWTWQDDPNPPADIPDAPVNLAISSSTTALNLTWKAPLQDPGCVTEYEIARSTVAGGSYSAIGTVANGVFSYSDTSAGAGTTYYYRVRAVGGDGYSEYSNAVSGQR